VSDIIKNAQSVTAHTSPADVSIDTTDLSGEFVRIVAQISRANQLLVEAEEICEYIEHLLEVEDARLTLRYRDLLKAKGEKPTESIIDAHVKCDINRINLCNRAISARAYKSRCRREVESLEAKSSMLISLGAHIRAEMNIDPNIRGRKP
jgi:hypothetical protein